VARSKRRRVVGSTLGIAGLCLATWATFWSPMLHVRRVQVAGASHVTTADIRAVTAVQGENLLLLSTGDVAARIEELPWVKDAEVDRRLPGTVSVKIQERRPAVVVTVAAGSWTIDSRGHVLEEGASSKGLPTLTGTALTRLAAGERIEADVVHAGLEVWRSLPRRVRVEVASIVAAAPERIALALRDGTVVRYGGADRLESKNEILTALLRRLSADGRKATYIDVSVPATPAIGPAPAAATPAPTAAP